MATQRELENLVIYMKDEIKRIINNNPEEFKRLIEEYRLKDITTYPYLQQSFSSGLVDKAFVLFHRKLAESRIQKRTTGGYKKRNRKTRKNKRKTNKKRK
jgi:hypothetical protein